MAVSYTKEQKADAKAAGQTLATIAVAGLVWQGGVTAAEKTQIVEFWTAFEKRRQAEDAQTGEG